MESWSYHPSRDFSDDSQGFSTFYTTAPREMITFIPHTGAHLPGSSQERRPQPEATPTHAASQSQHRGHLCKAHRRAAAYLLGSWDSEQVHQLMDEKTEVGSTSGLAEVTHLDQRQVEN